MNKHYQLRLLAFALATCSMLAVADAPEILKTAQDKQSYAIGVQTARNFKKDNIEVNPEMIYKGLLDGLSGERLLLNEAELKAVMSGLLGEMRQKMVANRKSLALKNSERGADFLAANKGKAGVLLLPNGVQYKVVNAGTGKKPLETDTVIWSYRGTLLDGKEFDGTPDGRQGVMPVLQMIPGLREAIKAMPVGSRWQIFVPAEKAYGERGVGNEIGPNELLIFDVELIGIK